MSINIPITIPTINPMLDELEVDVVLLGVNPIGWIE